MHVLHQRRGHAVTVISSDLGRHLGISIPGVGYAVERGEAIARDNNYQLVD